MPETVSIEKITETDPMHREANHGLMVRWINNDLATRANNDVRHSLVFYDEHKMFEFALPARVEDRLQDPKVVEALHSLGARYWSKGIV